MKDYYKTVDDEEDDIPLPNSALTKFIRNKRVKLINLLDYTQSQWYSFKERTTNKKLELLNNVDHLFIEDSRQLTNGVIITGMGLVSGLMLTKRLSRTSKFLIPSVLTYICFSYSLPQTRDLWFKKVYNWEKKKFPVWTKKQDEMQGEFNEGVKDCREFVNDIKTWFEKN